MPIRETVDRCPGLLRPHHARDGAMVRLRIPGGRVSGRAFTQLRAAAVRFGDGDIHLTSRANLQLRGLPVDRSGAVAAPVIDALRTAGFLPAPAHERVRNIVASPLSGIAGGCADVRGLITALDRGLCADAVLAGLPGRFLFGIDDGRGDIAHLGCDLWARADDAGAARIHAGSVAGPRVPLRDVPGALTSLARRFLAEDGRRWHVREMPGEGRELFERPDRDSAAGGCDRVAAGAARAPAADASASVTLAPPRHGAAPVPLGRIADGAVSALAPLGILSPGQSGAISAETGSAAAHETGVIVTPWRGIILPAADREALGRLDAAGLITDPASAWTRVTACAGSAGCARSAGDTRAAAREVVSGDPDRHVHIVGCPRSCGAPKADHELLLLGGRT